MTTFGPSFDKELPQFGLFHSALIIGVRLLCDSFNQLNSNPQPFYIEWNTSELCVPRKIMSRAAILSCDLEEISVVDKDRIEEVREKLAEIIVKWNVTKRYTNLNAKSEREGNCQDFVDDVLGALKIDLNRIYSGALGNYLKRMREKGTCEMEFRVDNDFAEKFGLKDKVTTFASHKDLDLFVHRMMKKDPELRRNYPQEWALLKSFDRAFWLRHLRDEKDDRWKSLDHFDVQDEFKSESDSDFEGTLIVSCPFGNPVDSNSFDMRNL